MKTHGRWVAWIAALALAAMLTATPREGAAGPPGPYRMPTDPGPQLGEPDEPSAQAPVDWMRLIFSRLPSWLHQFDARVRTDVTTKKQSPAHVSPRASAHE
jgi:hypothetical protein